MPFLKGEREGVAAQGVHLLVRRRRPDGHPLQRVEGRRSRAQEHEGIDVWQRQFTKLRVPNLYNLRTDPFERGDEHLLRRLDGSTGRSSVVPMQAFAAQWLESFKEFPPRQKPASFNLDEVMGKMAPKN